MTNWWEVEDLGLDQEFDELDPMAAPSASGFGSTDESDDEAGDVFDRPDGPWAVEEGFPDGFGVLRIWIDEHKQITKVRLSPSWRDKLGKTHLSFAFARAFAFINSYDQAPREVASLQASDHEAKDPFGWDQIDAVARRTRELDEKLEALGDGGYGHLEAQEAIGESDDKLCAIRLDEHGDLSGIMFNDRKLAEARVRQVTDAVVKAHAAALGNYQPPTYVEGERDEITRELHDLRNETLAMMRRGFR